MRKFFNVCMLLVATVCVASAQVQTPAPSPSCKTTQMVGLTEVTLDYSRPSVKERTVYGGLVPADGFWRTGANAATKIGFSTDVKLGGVDVKKGEYAVLTKVTDASWDIYLYPYESGSWGSYTEKEAAAVVNAKMAAMGEGHSVESFTIMFDHLRNASAHLVMAWGDRMAKAELTVPTDEMVEASIASTMSGPAGNQLYSAASYYFDEGKDMNKALDWINMAIDKEYNGFWVLKKKSEIQAAMGDKAGAIETAKMSLEAAEKAGNNDYIRMNNENLKKWAM